GSLIAAGGRLIATGPRFSFRDVVLTTATVDIDEIRLQRTRLSPGTVEDENQSQAIYKVVSASFSPTVAEIVKSKVAPPASWEGEPAIKEHEFSRAVALGLFDYLRKSRSRGFVISLSGGADSGGTACLCVLALRFAVGELGLSGIKKKLSHIPEVAEAGSIDECIRALVTCVYQSTRNSGARTLAAAREVATALGCTFFNVDVDPLVAGYSELASAAIGEPLSWAKHDVPLQNIQARVRGPFVWMIANLKGALLLATSNRSEAAVGYTTMDGDTAGGLSPIGGIDKAFLLRWLRWIESGGLTELGPLQVLSLITSQAPTAELRPPEASQTDEADLMPYPILDAIERWAIRDKKSPLEVFELLKLEHPDVPAKERALWVRRFFRLWSINQWKRERYAPSFHLDDENLDPKTWCRFPILSGGYEQELAELDAVLAVSG
ncbi:MAG: NAD(+) synthase, partial [Bdellovibrionales bacterium]|nr:NAD(+) synthase [Bdellovibrionales bacterium]